MKGTDDPTYDANTDLTDLVLYRVEIVPGVSAAVVVVVVASEAVRRISRLGLRSPRIVRGIFRGPFCLYF